MLIHLGKTMEKKNLKLHMWICFFQWYIGAWCKNEGNV